MNDVRCRNCSEPYSQYSLQHEIPEWDDQPDDAYERFMNGEGCPTCDWGEKEVDDEKSDGERMVEQVSDIMHNTDDDPTKYI